MRCNSWKGPCSSNYGHSLRVAPCREPNDELSLVAFERFTTLALWKANEAANGPVDTKTASNIINAPVDSMPKDEQDTDSIQSASTSVETGPEDYPVEQRSHKTIVDQSTDNTYDLPGRSGELEIEVQYEDASPADQRAYDKYINELGYHVSYKEFRFSNKYKLAETN